MVENLLHLSKINLLISISILSLFADNLSINTEFFLKNLPNNRSLNSSTIRGFIETDKNSRLPSFININSYGDKISTVSLKASDIERIKDISSIKKFSISKKLHLVLDSSKIYGDCNSIYLKSIPETKVKGDGVVVGIVDIGFDYTNPAFKDKNGDLRIMAVWDQSDTTGVNPSGYDYGSFLKSSKEILNKKHCSSSKNNFHGTHVAGIATGREVIDSLPFSGVAPNAKIILVSTTMTDSDIYDGVTFIEKYAREHNMRSVINLSLSSSVGPRDGTSQLERGYENLANNGFLIVNAAGNSGGINQHLRADIKSGDTVKTYAGDLATKPIDFWGENGYNFTVITEIVDKAKDSTIYQSSPINIHSGIIDTSITIDGKSLSLFYGADSLNSSNKKSEIILYFQDSSSTLYNNYRIKLLITSDDIGVINCWNSQYSGFTSLDKDGYINGDNNSTIGDGGSSSKGVITVGSFKVRKGYLNYLGEYQTLHPLDNGIVEDLSWFSSLGPTTDSRIKPEIVAPGHEVISTLNSYTNLYGYSDSSIITNKFIYNNREYSYGAAGGTSMASPFVTGAIALLLQVDSSLKRDDILAVIKNSSKQDQFTGNISTNGSNSWGYGKVDVRAMVEEVESRKTYNNIYKDGNIAILGVSKSRNGTNISINFTIPKGSSIRVYNTLGKEIYNGISSIRSSTISLPYLPNGLYILRSGQFLESENSKEINLKFFVK